MKKTIEVTYGCSYKINKGSYEQEAPLYSAKTITEVSPQETGLGQGEYAKVEFNQLKAIVDPLLAEHVAKSKNNIDHIRVREKDGKKYPSVTSILNPDPFKGDPAFGIRGIEYHRAFNYWLTTGHFTLDTTIDIAPLKWDIGLDKWIETFGARIKRDSAIIEQEVFNDAYAFSGEADFIADVEVAEGVWARCLVDIKTGGYKWEQLFAYAQCLNALDVRYVAIADLKKCEFKVKHVEEVKYWERFLIKRGEFKSRFNI